MFSFFFVVFGKGWGEVKQMLLCTHRYLYLRVEYNGLIWKGLVKRILESNEINTQTTKIGVTFV